MMAGSNSRATVLLLDDNPQHLKLYQVMIEKGPFRIVPVLIGRQGWTLPDEHPDVVTLDYKLDGRLVAAEVAEWVKSKYPAVPIILLSDMERLPDEMRVYATAFVKKGEPEVLMQTLMKVTSRPGNATSA